MYARVLRRVVGVPRHDDSTGPTDLEVRTAVGMPSLDCLLVTQRLLYIARLLKHRPCELWALSQQRVDGTPLPWVSQILHDFLILYRCTAEVRRVLPVPAGDNALDKWFFFIADYLVQWADFARSLFFMESVLDNRIARTHQ